MSAADVELLDHLPPELLDQLCAFYEAEWWTQGRDREGVERMLAGSTEVLAAVRGDRLVGFARALSDGAFRAIVFDVIVEPAERGTGLGRVLMDAILARPSVAASNHVELMCAEEVRPFYERWGFAVDDSGAFRMVRDQYRH